MTDVIRTPFLCHRGLVRVAVVVVLCMSHGAEVTTLHSRSRLNSPLSVKYQRNNHEIKSSLRKMPVVRVILQNALGLYQPPKTFTIYEGTLTLGCVD